MHCALRTYSSHAPQEYFVAAIGGSGARSVRGVFRPAQTGAKNDSNLLRGAPRKIHYLSLLLCKGNHAAKKESLPRKEGGKGDQDLIFLRRQSAAISAAHCKISTAKIKSAQLRKNSWGR